MDQALKDKICALADEHGLDPEQLEAALSSGDMPEELQAAMEEVLGSLGAFAQALDKLDE